MKADNSSYTVTAPDLKLTEHGANILITCNDQDKIEDIKYIFENNLIAGNVFNIQRAPTNENTVSWMWYVSQSAEIMVLDIDTCSPTDVCAALLRPVDDNKMTIFLSEKYKRKDMIRLINATHRYPILSSLDDLEAYLRIELKLDDMIPE